MTEPPDIPGLRVLEPLGEGGVGTVWLAQDTVSGRRVAVKILSDDAPDEERRRLSGWESEARAIRHPGLVKVIRAGEAGGRFFVVMEHVPGRDLRRRVETDGPLSEAEALDVAVAVAEGLREARRSGIVHGDVKPANVLLTDRGGVKVCDIGLARPGPERVGTPSFMAPEQIRGELDLDERTDLYGLGLTLWFAVTGELPFPGDDTRVVVDAQLTRPLSDPRDRRAGLTDGFSDLVLRMAAKDPGGRPPNWDAVLAEIEALRDDTGPMARRLGTAGTVLGRRDVRWSLALLCGATVIFLLVLALRGEGGNEEGRDRALVAEAAARGALEEIDRRLASHPGDELEAYEALRRLIARYPATEAGHEALVRVKAIRVRLEDLRRSRFQDAMNRAREHAAIREFDRGISFLEAQAPTLGETEWGPALAAEIDRISGVARATLRELRSRVDDLVQEGQLDEALGVLDEAPYERAGGLAEEIDSLRDHIRLMRDR